MGNGPPPPECQQSLARLKYTVIAMMVFGVCRLVTGLAYGDMMGALNMVLCVTIGVFLLKDDVHLHPVYAWMSTTICQQCAQQGQGGVQCLVPFLGCCAINLFFDLLQFMGGKRIPAGSPYQICLLGCLASEISSTYLAYVGFKACRDADTGEHGATEMESGGGGSYVQADDRQALTGAPAGGGSAGGGGAAGGFAVFSGQGNR